MASERVHPKWRSKEGTSCSVDSVVFWEKVEAVRSCQRQDKAAAQSCGERTKDNDLSGLSTLCVQIGSSDGTHCIKKLICKGRVMYSICAVLHCLKGGIAYGIVFLGFKISLSWLAELEWRVRKNNGWFCKQKEKRMVALFFAVLPASFFSHISKITSRALPEWELKLLCCL